MRQTSSLALIAAAAGSLALAGCTDPDPESQDNPFTQDMADDGKEDSAYLNPDGFEVEVDLEGDVLGPAARLEDGPAALGQFALTNLRKSEVMYLESLAEDGSAPSRIEWLINGQWVPNQRVVVASQRKHWRMRGINAVILHSTASSVSVGKVYNASVPMNPFTIYTDARDTCADDDDHISLDASVYWYRWEPAQASCRVAKQQMKVTVSKKFPSTQRSVYPEYDQLTADRKVTMVILFGQIDDGAITDSETGMQSFKRYGRWLTAAKFKKVTTTVGERYEKVLVGGVTAQIDLYSPREFSGLGDYAHFANFQKAIGEHEVVVWDGHSMLGASDFWSRPTYPRTYQIFLYGGCLGYEYYVRPILAGKGGTWANLDLMSSVVEVSASANEFAGPAIAKIIYAIEHGGKSTWRQILMAVRTNVGDSTFGVAGVRDNCYTPTGSRCTN